MFIGKAALKMQVQRTGLAMAPQSNTNYTTQEFPPPARAKLTSLPAQEGTATPPGLQPHFELGPPTI